MLVYNEVEIYIFDDPGDGWILHEGMRAFKCIASERFLRRNVKFVWMSLAQHIWGTRSRLENLHGRTLCFVFFVDHCCCSHSMTDGPESLEDRTRLGLKNEKSLIHNSSLFDIQLDLKTFVQMSVIFAAYQRIYRLTHT